MFFKREEVTQSLIDIVSIAKRNQVKLYATSRSGQWKAHCPVCRDTKRSYHLYVNEEKDAFYCHKCGAQGGAIQFHAWLRDISFEQARDELYPHRRQKRRHPAERLPREALKEAGILLRTRMLKPIFMDDATWAKYQKRSLDWVWREWCDYQRMIEAQTKRLTQLLIEADDKPRRSVNDELEPIHTGGSL